MYNGIYSHIIEGFATLRCILAANDGVFQDKKKKDAKCVTRTDVANLIFPFPVTLTGCIHSDQGHKLAHCAQSRRPLNWASVYDVQAYLRDARLTSRRRGDASRISRLRRYFA